MSKTDRMSATATGGDECGPEATADVDAPFAEVAVPRPLPQLFTYRIPADLRGRVAQGSQVEVPFGRGRSPGFVVGFRHETDIPSARLKAIAAVTYPEPVFDAAILKLARWVAEYYVASLGDVLMTALPGGLRTESRRARPYRAPETLGLATEPARLTSDQTSAVDAITDTIASRTFATHLLYGVTGSGKTEVYVRASEHAVAEGGQVLILVPEIALSFQVVERFRLAFGDRVGVFHSGLTKRARQDAWRHARTGELAVAVGARSAVFTPLPDLRLVIVDEENEGTYKQSDTPRYHAREVAIVRASHAGATVVLGSATPSLESFANAKRGKYRLLTLPERIDNRARATVRCEDLRLDEKRDAHGPFGLGDSGRVEKRRPILCRSLAKKVADRLWQGDQVILFLNRRGYAPFVQCRHCGVTMTCTQCDVSLTYHRRTSALVCHYCGTTREHVSACETCGSLRLNFGGIGTERVEDELGVLFPRARVLRLDTDTTRTRGSYQKILKAFGKGEADILLGTQMVAKGLDFPNVTLVGVINADSGLNMPDFRSAERTFQLLTQVAGRAGRGDKPGEVVLQSYYPEHYALTSAAAQDFEEFFAMELRVRRELGYPPFTRMANLLFDGANEERVMAAADAIDHVLATVGGEGGSVGRLGPAPQPLSRLKGKYRWHLALQAPKHARLAAAASTAMAWFEGEKRRFAGVRLTVDMDPIDLL